MQDDRLPAANADAARLAFLARASAELAASFDYESMLARVTRLAIPDLADVCHIDILTEDGSLQRVTSPHPDPEKNRAILQLSRRFPIDLENEHHPVARVLRTGRVELMREVPPSVLDKIARDPEHRRLGSMVLARSAVVAPLTARGRVLGVITFARLEPGRLYGPEDVALAEDLAHRAALAIENARLYQREHRTAETLQRSLLPTRLPELPGFTVAARYLPSGRSEIGGDWYDVIQTPEGGLVIAIGDVAGRGIPAASLMGSLRNALRAYALEGHAPGATADRLNGLIQRFHPGQMATLIYAALDPEALTFRLVNAGHLPPLMLRADGSASFVEGPRGVPLGMEYAGQYRDFAVRVEPGARVIFYTDGLVEDPKEPIDHGLARLRTAAAGNPSDPERLCDHVLGVHLPEGPIRDDVALVVVGVDPLSDSFQVHVPAKPATLGPLRSALRRWLKHAGLDGDGIEEVVIASGEAATNVVKHAYGLRGGMLEVSGTRADDHIQLTVRDTGRWRAPRDSDPGRGLALMRGLVYTLEIQHSPQGTEVHLGRRVENAVRG